MTLRQTANSGPWNTPATWAGGVVPTAADTWEILNGHTVTIEAELTANPLAGTIKSGGRLKPSFQMVTSLFNGNITIESGGDIYASRLASSIFRIGAIIYANGENSVNYGTQNDPISNISIGAILEFYCTTDNQSTRAINCTAQNSVTAYGAQRTLLSTLSQAGLSTDNTIVLADDLALRPGTLAQVSQGLADMIVVGQSSSGIPEGTGGPGVQIDVFLVSGYDPATHTVTLGDAGAGATYWYRGGVTPTWNTLDTDRSVGTKVFILNNNVCIRGNAYNRRPYIMGNGDGYQNQSINLTNATIAWYYIPINQGQKSNLKNCTMYATGGTNGAHKLTVDGCVFACCSTFLYGYNDSIIINSSFIGSSSTGMNLTDSTMKNCYISGCQSVGLTNSKLYNNVITGNYSGISSVRQSALYSTSISYSGSNSSSNYAGTKDVSGSIFVDCNLSHNAKDFSFPINTKIYNTNLLSDINYSDTLTGFLDIYQYRNELLSLYSYNHNGESGAFKAWLAGGTGISDSTYMIGNTTPHKYTLSSSIYKIHEDVAIKVPAYKSITITNWLRKDESMSYLPRMLVTLAEDDPLIDETTIIHSFTMTDSLNSWESDNFTYTNLNAYDIDLNIKFLAKNSTGNVWMAIINNFVSGNYFNML